MAIFNELSFPKTQTINILYDLYKAAFPKVDHNAPSRPVQNFENVIRHWKSAYEGLCKLILDFVTHTLINVS